MAFNPVLELEIGISGPRAKGDPLRCPDCGEAVTDEVAYCFTCFKHVSSTPHQPEELEEAPSRSKEMPPSEALKPGKARFSRLKSSVAAESSKPSVVQAPSRKEPDKKAESEVAAGPTAPDHHFDESIRRHVQELEEIFKEMNEGSESTGSPG